MALSRLGTGPFTVVNVLEPDFVSHGESLPTPTPVGNPDDVWGRCACCGAKLSWRVLLEDEDGKVYVVGSTCAKRAEEGVDLRRLNTLRTRALKRERDRKLADEGFVAWAESQPHPKGWAGKSLLDDLRYWTFRKAPKMGALRKAWRTFHAGEKADTTIALEKADAEARERLATWLREHAEWAAEQPHPYRDKVLRSRTKRLRNQKRIAAIKAEVEALTLADYVQWTLDNRSDAAGFDRALTKATALRETEEKAKAAPSEEERRAVVLRWGPRRNEAEEHLFGTPHECLLRPFNDALFAGDEATLEELWTSEPFAPVRESLGE